LYWEACRALEQLFIRVDDKVSAHDFRQRALLIEKNIGALWDNKTGMFYAASVTCRQIDIWGNAYAIYIGFPLGKKKSRIVNYLAQNFDAYIMKGQIRHLPQPEFWQNTLVPIKPGTYQNGAYWGTASGWVAFALAKTRPDLAQTIFHDLLQDYQERGVYECINKNYTKLKNYVASAVNPLGALRKIERRK